MTQYKLNNVKIETLIDGVFKSVRNAQQLCDEAELFHQNKMYARSYTLSHLAREEFGKSFMLYRTVVEVALGRTVDWKNLNKRFRNHKNKIINDRFTSMMLCAGIEINGTKDDPETFLRGIEFTNNKKNASIYVDYKDGEFVSPEDIITEKISRRNLDLAIHRIVKLVPTLSELSKIKNCSKEELQKRYPIDILDNPKEYLPVILEVFAEINKT